MKIAKRRIIGSGIPISHNKAPLPKSIPASSISGIAKSTQEDQSEFPSSAAFVREIAASWWEPKPFISNSYWREATPDEDSVV
jgi:hypothetical protein